MSDPELFHFDDDGRYPNSPLPLLLYRAVRPADPNAMLRGFASHGWSNGWRNGIFAFHHFHSIAHEVLGIAAGSARVMFGGPSGRIVAVGAGDVVVIPAGVAHRRMDDGNGLVVVGAYPGGSSYDLRRGDPAEHAAALRAIAAVPCPDTDPVGGPDAGLRRFWQPDRSTAVPAP